MIFDHDLCTHTLSSYFYILLFFYLFLYFYFYIGHVNRLLLDTIAHYINIFPGIEKSNIPTVTFIKKKNLCRSFHYMEL